MTLMMPDSFKAHKPRFESFIQILGHNKIQVLVSSTLVVDDLSNYIQMFQIPAGPQGCCQEHCVAENTSLAVYRNEYAQVKLI